nr:LexA family transcriptional regulator [uncultured Undibacterium sp.]
MAAKPLNENQLEDAKRLRSVFELRKNEDPSLSQERLAYACGWKTQGTVNQYMHGKIPLNLNAVQKFAEALRVSIEEISPDLSKQIVSLAKSLPKQGGITERSELLAMGTRRIPLVSYAQAVEIIEVNDLYFLGDVSEHLLTDLDLGTKAFALQIKGDSMLPDFKEGDRIVIDPEVEPLPGDFVVAKSGHEEATFKKYRPTGRIDSNGNVIFDLVPLNADYAPMHSDVVPLRIIGTMIEHRRYRKK